MHKTRHIPCLCVNMEWIDGPIKLHGGIIHILNGEISNEIRTSIGLGLLGDAYCMRGGKSYELTKASIFSWKQTLLPGQHRIFPTSMPLCISQLNSGPYAFWGTVLFKTSLNGNEGSVTLDIKLYVSRILVLLSTGFVLANTCNQIPGQRTCYQRGRSQTRSHAVGPLFTSP